MKYQVLVLILTSSFTFLNSCINNLPKNSESKEISSIPTSPAQESKLEKAEDKYLRIANEYLKEKITDKEISTRIRFDTIVTTPIIIVTYTIENNDNINEWNLVKIIINENLEIDTIHSDIRSAEIRKHIVNPKQNRLSLNKDQAKRIAFENGIKGGIKPWKVMLSVNSENRKEVKWVIESTLFQTEYRAGGQVLSIDICTGETKYMKWDEVQ